MPHRIDPKPVTHFGVHMPPHVHEKLADWAKEANASINALMVGILQKAVDQYNRAKSQDG